MEGGNWYSYTFNSTETTSNQRIEFVSVIPTQYDQMANRLIYTGGNAQINMLQIFANNPDANEVWITVPNTSGDPVFQFTPPDSKVVRFFNPWSLGAPCIMVESIGIIRMRSIPNFCGWFRYSHYGTDDSLHVKFVNSLDSSLYSANGSGDGNFINLSGSFASEDTVWIVPAPYPDGPPGISSTFPEILGNCGETLTLAAKLRDKGVHPDFEAEVGGLVTGMVENKLGNDGKPVKTDSASLSDQFDDWFIAEDLGNGYTNEVCYNLQLTKNDEGLFEYDTNAFFPLDDFKYLDAAGTIPNPNYTTQSGHDYSFTMELGAQFEYIPGQTFYFRGDDDVWVYIDSQLVVDLGGIHGPVEGKVDLDTLGLFPGQTYGFKLFFAERHCCGSNFRMVTSIDLRTSSNLFYNVSKLSPGVSQFDMYQKITTGNLSCDFDAQPVDTQKAMVEFYISGPPFSDPQKLSSGLSFGGITIAADYTSIIIDETAFSGLPSGDYQVTFYSLNDKTQSGTIYFNLPEVVKPPRISNPVRTAAFYADNGYGRVDRAEIYFKNYLTTFPDSITLSWPDVLERRTAYRDRDIFADSTDSSHITIRLSSPFKKEITTFYGTDRLGFAYFFDTSFVPPIEVAPFRLADSVGPLITGAVLVEGSGAADDTLLLTFSEPIKQETVAGNSFILIKSDTSAVITVISIATRADTLQLIFANMEEQSPREGDSIRINPDGPLTDIYTNHSHRKNRPVPLLLRKSAPDNQQCSLHGYRC